jgi:hypothetical protein
MMGADGASGVGVDSPFGLAASALVTRPSDMIAALKTDFIGRSFDNAIVLSTTAASTGSPSSSVPLEILHRTLMLFRGGTACECAEIAPFSGLGVRLSRIEAELAGGKLADHRQTSITG